MRLYSRLQRSSQYSLSFLSRLFLKEACPIPLKRKSFPEFSPRVTVRSRRECSRMS